MTVLEVGLLYGGLPVLQKDFHELVKGKDLDPVIRSGLLSAINTMASDFFGDSIEEYKMKGYTICLKPVELQGKTTLNLYAIIDRTSKASDVHNALKRLASKAPVALKGFSTMSTVNPRFFKKFEKEIDEVMRDMKLKPEQRADKLFS
ncbi:MAG: hypothetical protein ACFFD4_40370 [Candidatus Odinarchaeota archaeon]